MRFLIGAHEVFIVTYVWMAIEVLNKFKLTIYHHHLIFILSKGRFINHSFIIKLFNLNKIDYTKASFANFFLYFYR